MGTYTQNLSYMVQLELQRDAEQEENARNPTMDEYAASLVKTINVCLSHVEIAERVVAAKGYDWQRQARIRKAQYKPIDMNIKRLETMGRGHLIPQEARDFMATR